MATISFVADFGIVGTGVGESVYGLSPDDFKTFVSDALVALMNIAVSGR